jgi:hypothetical protein
LTWEQQPPAAPQTVPSEEEVAPAPQPASPEELLAQQVAESRIHSIILMAIGPVVGVVLCKMLNK